MAQTAGVPVSQMTPRIQPFHGILYDTRNVDIGQVVAPPYDVITPSHQQSLRSGNAHNIVRLILGGHPDWYSDAAETFRQWKQDGILVRDPVQAIYLLSQSFVAGGERRERRGIIAACRLEELGQGLVYPHEKTLSKPKEDRFRLFTATGAMFSQVFAIYGDPQKALDSLYDRIMAGGPPALDVAFDGVRNSLWRISEAAAQGELDAFFSDKHLYVADGHHRYETALLYRDAMRKEHPGFTGHEAFNFIPMFLSNMDDPGLVILPTHRVLHGVAGFHPPDFLSRLEKSFSVEHMESLARLTGALKGATGHAFGLILPEGCYLLHFTGASADLSVLRPELRELDVAVLHTAVFQDILGMSEADQLAKRFLDYEIDAERARDAVRQGASQAAFLLNPTRVNQVRSVAEAGLTMPQKSTFFYPKLLSGLVTYSFLD